MTIEILPQPEKRLLAVAVTDKLTDTDYDELRPEMDLRAEQYESFDLLVDITELTNPEPSVIKQELDFTRDYADRIGHMALVSDDAIWNGLTDFVGKPLSAVLGIELERFAERSVATEWLASKRS